MADDEYLTQHFTSAVFSGRDRVEAFRETYGRNIMKLRIDPSPDHPFELDFKVQGIPGFAVATGRLSPTRNTHSSDMVDDDDLVLVVAQEGAGSLHQIGREVSLKSGQATLVSNGETGVFYGHVASSLLTFRLSRTILSSLIPDIEATLARQIAKDNSALKLMTSYARIMSDADAMSSPDIRRAVALHMHDLAALALGAGRDATENARNRGIRMARLHALKDDITLTLSQPSLSAETLAARHGVTRRYVSMIFASEELSVSEYILSQRLLRAHRMLSDPRLLDRTISAIAYDVGFHDLSYFNRSFRRRFNATPSDIRAAAR